MKNNKFGWLGLFFAVILLSSPLVLAEYGTREAVQDNNDQYTANYGFNAYQFSPLHGGELGRVRLYTVITHYDAAQQKRWGRSFWALEIRGPGRTGKLVRTAQGITSMDGSGNALGEFFWDGRDDLGRLVEPGMYSFTFNARFMPDRNIGRIMPTSYAEAGSTQDVEEAMASTANVIVDYGLSERTAQEIRLQRAAGACQQQQNIPLESGFGYNFYYGSTHNHSNYSDGGQDPSNCKSGNKEGSGASDPTAVYNMARNSAGLDYFFITDHNHLFDEAVTNSTPPLTEAKVKARYQAGLQAAVAATVDGSFVGIWGQETGVLTNSDQGHVIFVESPKLFGWDSCTSCTGANAECTAGSNCYFDVYVPKRYGYLKMYQRLVENPSAVGPLGIFCHPDSGNFDGFAYDANADAAIQGIAVKSGLAFSLATTCSDANMSSSTYFSRYTQALNKGFHVAPTGEQDAHCSNYGIAVPTRTVYLIPRTGGTLLTRTNIMTAHKNRRFYATEDPNLQLVFATGDGVHVMGEIFTAASPLTLRAAVYDPDNETTSTIEFWRGQIGAGAPTAAYKSAASQATFSITETLTSGTYYYFVHVVQADGHDAWSAPMWITYGGSTQTYSIAGSAGTTGVTVTAGSVTATSDASGNYTLPGLVAGTYTVTPSKSGCTFSPATLSVTVGPSATGKNFTPNCPVVTYSIGGSVGTTGVTVTAGSVTATSDASGNYTLPGLVAGTYTVMPSKSGCTFSPATLSVTVGPNAAGKNFTPTCPVVTYSIAGSAGTTGVTVTAGSVTATSDASGNYTLPGLVAGTYTVTPSKSGCTFSPATLSVTVGPSATGKNFTPNCPVVTYSIGGSVGTTGVTVTAGSVTATSDASGNYTLPGLVAGTYTVTPGKSGCTFSPATLSVTVGPSATGKNFTPTCGTGDILLTSGTALSGQSVGLKAWKYYYINVPTGATRVEFITSASTADIDIYTRFNAKPDSATYTCRPYTGTGNETCTHDSPSVGVWYLGVFGYAAGSYTVTATVTTGSTTTPTEKLTDGGFETLTSSANGTPTNTWTRAAYTGTSFNILLANATYPHSGTDHAYLGVNNSSSQTLQSATVAIPSTATQATLSFWVSIVTEEVQATVYDKLEIQLVNTSGTVLATLGTLSNVDKTAAAGTYVQKSYSVLGQKGQSVRIRFKATNDSTYTTTFRVDDVSLMTN